MARDQAFNDYIVGDVLRDVPGIVSKAMFGGWSIYKDGVIFGLIADGELYFKVDDSNIENYKQRESHPCVYEGKNKQVTMSYWTVPEDILENQSELLEWIEKSIKASSKKLA